MSALLLLLGSGIGFALLAVAAHAFRGSRAVLVIAGVWVIGVATYVVGSLPSPEVDVHSFERSPAPGIAATVAGALAGATLVIQRRGSRGGRVVLALQAGICYALASAVVGVVTFLIIAG